MYLKMVVITYFCRIGVTIFLYFKLRNETDVEIDPLLTTMINESSFDYENCHTSNCSMKLFRSLGFSQCD